MAGRIALCEWPMLIISVGRAITDDLRVDWQRSISHPSETDLRMSEIHDELYNVFR